MLRRTIGLSSADTYDTIFDINRMLAIQTLPALPQLAQIHISMTKPMCRCHSEHMYTNAAAYANYIRHVP